MQACNICLQDQIPNNQMVKWHPQERAIHRAHESCVDCVALSIFTQKQQMQDISCPDCRQISVFDSASFTFSRAYTLGKVTTFSVAYFGTRYLISPMISCFLSMAFLSNLDNDAIRWSHYGEPPISWIHPSYSKTYLALKDVVQGYVNQGHTSTILSAIDTSFQMQQLITQTLVYIVALRNIYAMSCGENRNENAKGMALQVLHLIMTRFLMSYCDVTAEDVTSDLQGKFSTDSYPPANNPRLLAKTIEDVSLGLFIFGGFAALALLSEKPKANQREPVTVTEIKAALLDKSYALKPAANDHRAF